jgi:uncharacterized alpha-E superfamily protein
MGENLYWLGRYTERTEQQVRLAQVVLPLGAGDGPAQPAVLRAASQLAAHIGIVPPGTPTLVQAPRVFERALAAAAGDESGAWSVAFNLAALERASQAVRERLLKEMAGAPKATATPRSGDVVRAPGPVSTEDIARRIVAASEGL